MDITKYLEIGSGENPTEGYTHLDINPDAPHVEIAGDIRSIFIPQDYNSQPYPQLMALRPSGPDDELLMFSEIRLYHVVEHFHWYYQPYLWRWLHQLLEYNGFLDIETPDLEWILKTYWKHQGWGWFQKAQDKALSLVGRKRKIRFPLGTHPDINSFTEYNLSRFLAFSLWSGGSRGKETGMSDYHLGLYDRCRLATELRNTGFIVSMRRDFKHGTLRVTAHKQSLTEKDYFDKGVIDESSVDSAS